MSVFVNRSVASRLSCKLRENCFRIFFSIARRFWVPSICDQKKLPRLSRSTRTSLCNPNRFEIHPPTPGLGSSRIRICRQQWRSSRCSADGLFTGTASNGSRWNPAKSITGSTGFGFGSRSLNGFSVTVSSIQYSVFSVQCSVFSVQTSGIRRWKSPVLQV